MITMHYYIAQMKHIFLSYIKSTLISVLSRFSPENENENENSNRPGGECAHHHLIELTPEIP